MPLLVLSLSHPCRDLQREHGNTEEPELVKAGERRGEARGEGKGREERRGEKRRGEERSEVERGGVLYYTRIALLK